MSDKPEMTKDEHGNVVAIPPRRIRRMVRGHEIEVVYNRERDTFEWTFQHNPQITMTGEAPTPDEACAQAIDRLEVLLGKEISDAKPAFRKDDK